MRNLNLHEVEVHNIKEKTETVIKVVQTKTSIFYILSNGNCMQIVKTTVDKKTHGVQVNKQFIVDAVYDHINNLLHMAGPSYIETYNIETKESTYTIVQDGFDHFSWSENFNKVVLFNKVGFLRVLNFDSKTLTDTGYVESFKRLEPQSLGTNTEVTNNTPFDLSQTYLEWSKQTETILVGFRWKNQYYFQVYDADLQCLGTSQIVPGLSPIITLRPDGNEILGTVRIKLRRNRCIQRLLFFERSGKLRVHVNLLVQCPIKQLKWNDQGDVLLVHQQSQYLSRDFIFLYSLANDIWQIKQKFYFDIGNNIKNCTWVSFNHRHINLQVQTELNLVTYSWNWVANVTHWSKDDKTGVVANIDNECLYIIMLSRENKPPPLHTQCLKFNDVINFVRFEPTGKYLLVVLHNLTGVMWEITSDGVTMMYSFDLKSCLHVDTNLPLTLYNFTVESDKSFYAISATESAYTVIQFTKIEDTSKLYTKSWLLSNSVLNHVFPHDNSIIINSDLGVLKITKDGVISKLMKTVLAGQINIIFINEKMYIISLHENIFSINSKTIAENVTSYIIAYDYLLFTTNKNILYIIKLNKRGVEMLEQKRFTEMFSRSIPEGVVLIAPIPDTRNILFENARGDYETIQPRILSIHFFEELFLKCEYKRALEIVKHDRINQNIIIDIDPNFFLEHVDDFVSKIQDSELIASILVSLQDENVSVELYPNCFDRQASLSTYPNKKSVFIEKLTNSMMKIDKEYFVISIVTGFVCSHTEHGMKSALKILKERIEQEKNGQYFSNSSDDIFTAIIALSSIEAYLDTALLMEEFDLIHWSTPRTTYDPLEYMPFINDLKSMEKNYREYKIKNHLRKYEEAFLALIKCNHVLNELKTLLLKSKQYHLILKYVRIGNQWYLPLMEYYADYLKSVKHYEDAGHIYKRISDYENSLQCFLNGHNMNESLNVIYIMKQHSKQINFETYLNTLATDLISVKKFKEASTVYEMHLNKHDQAIYALIGGRQWSDALHLITKYDAQNILELNYKPALQEHFDLLIEFIETRKKKFVEYRDQLLNLWKKNISALNQIRNPEITDAIPENITNLVQIDVESLAASFISKTRSTTSRQSTSSRASKKRDRNIMKTRPGSQYENIALMRELHILCTEVFDVAKTIHDVCLCMINLHYESGIDVYSVTMKLHSLYDETVDIMNKSIPQIWCEDLNNPPTPITPEASILRQNFDLLDLPYRVPPSLTFTDWKVKTLIS